MNVKNPLRYLSNIALSVILLLIAINTNAQEEVAHQRFKCHVELLGGNQTIYYSALLTNESLTQASTKLENRSILTTLSPNKLKVYKVKECVLNNESFSSAKSRNVENQMEL